MSGDHEQEYSLMGTQKTSSLRYLSFRSFSSSRELQLHFKGKKIDVRDVSKKLGVRYAWKEASANQATGCKSPHS